MILLAQMTRHVENGCTSMYVCAPIFEHLISESSAAVCVTIILPSWHVHPLTAFSHLQNGPLAIGTVRGEEFIVVLFTVRAALSLKEPAVAQLLATRCAHKVLGVPHLTQRCD